MNFCYKSSSALLFGEEWHIIIENQPLLISEFKDQFEQLARGQVDKAKSSLNEITSFDFDQYTVGFFIGHQMINLSKLFWIKQRDHKT